MMQMHRIMHHKFMARLEIILEKFFGRMLACLWVPQITLPLFDSLGRQSSERFNPSLAQF